MFIRAIDIMKDNKGASITIITLLLIPILVLLWVSSININKSISDYDIGLQSSLSEAVKSASFMVDEVSVAIGKPNIDHELAHEAFKEILNKRIKHGEIDYYQLLVFNYGYGGEGEVHIYSYDNGELQYEELNNIVGEKKFYVSDSGVSLTSGDSSISLDEPGCVGVAKLKSEEFLKKSENTGTRWAVSSIYLAKDFN